MVLDVSLCVIGLLGCYGVSTIIRMTSRCDCAMMLLGIIRVLLCCYVDAPVMMGLCLYENEVVRALRCACKIVKQVDYENKVPVHISHCWKV